MLRTSSRFSSVAPEQITRQKLTVAAVGSAPMKSRGFNFFPPPLHLPPLPTSFLLDPPFPTSDSSAFYILSSWLPVTQYTRTTDHEIAHSRETFPSSATVLYFFPPIPSATRPPPFVFPRFFHRFDHSKPSAASVRFARHVSRFTFPPACARARAREPLYARNHDFLNDAANGVQPDRNDSRKTELP